MLKRSLIIEGMLGIAALAGCKLSSASDAASTVKIVGGSDVSAGDDVAPSTIALLIQSPQGGELCSGTLIGDGQLVTAAHCVDGRAAADITVVFGQTVPDDPLAGNTQPASGATRHPSYSGPGSDHDLGLVTFEGGLPPGYAAVPIASPAAVTAGASLILAGFGATGENGDGTGLLRRAVAQVETTDATAREFQQVEGQGQGTCYGDSGGPAYLSVGEQLALAGATSRGTNCDVGNGIYTNVTLFQGWMKCTFQALGHPLATLADDASSAECGSAAAAGPSPQVVPPGGQTPASGGAIAQCIVGADGSVSCPTGSPFGP